MATINASVFALAILTCLVSEVLGNGLNSSSNHSAQSFPGVFYVSSNRLGCVMVKSQEPCPATSLSPDLAIDYETDTEMVNISLDEARMANASAECISALTTTYCSKLTPRCYPNGSKGYGDARKACIKARRECPQDSLETPCETLEVGLQPLSRCVKPSKAINGSCPQPKYKMPEDKLELYIRSSVEYERSGYFSNLSTAIYSNGSKMFSSECVSKIIELYCLPFYCSPDEKQIIVEYTLEECELILSDCFDKVIDNLYEGYLKETLLEIQEDYVDNCVFYPDVIEPTEETGTTPTTAAPSFQNMSSTPSVKNATTTPQQEISSIMPNANISSTPPGQNISTPPGTMSSHPEDTETPTPSEKTKKVTKLFIPPSSTTAGNEHCQYFPSMLLLAFLVAFNIINKSF
ncbi:uncharacterized protein LOC114533846 [Dendronephthya gigantea]|uniref:uncharacterized protein LOC114533846 n=1 Tax=Dendronephthya gigantea TaxID=151771 RepID=UPI0010694600|nr:uncharacterized protein LOC114533846 [Dendronephthya gigantea]